MPSEQPIKDTKTLLKEGAKELLITSAVWILFMHGLYFSLALTAGMLTCGGFTFHHITMLTDWRIEITQAITSFLIVIDLTTRLQYKHPGEWIDTVHIVRWLLQTSPKPSEACVACQKAIQGELESDGDHEKGLQLPHMAEAPSSLKKD